METQNLVSRYAKKKYKPYKTTKVTGSIFENVPDRRFDGWALNEVLCSNLTYMLLKNGKFAYIYFIVDLYDREIV